MSLLVHLRVLLEPRCTSTNPFHWIYSLNSEVHATRFASWMTKLAFLGDSAVLRHTAKTIESRLSQLVLGPGIQYRDQIERAAYYVGLERYYVEVCCSSRRYRIVDVERKPPIRNYPNSIERGGYNGRSPCSQIVHLGPCSTHWKRHRHTELRSLVKRPYRSASAQIYTFGSKLLQVN